MSALNFQKYKTVCLIECFFVFQLFGVVCSSGLSEANLQEKYNSVYDSVFPGLFQLNPNGTDCSKKRYISSTLSLRWINNQMSKMSFEFPKAQVKAIVANSHIDLPASISCDFFHSNINKINDKMESVINLTKSGLDSTKQINDSCQVTNFYFLHFSFKDLKFLNESKILSNMFCTKYSNCNFGVKILDLSNNSLRHFQHIFCDLHNLTVLNLSHNNIKLINKSSFGNLKNILWINLSRNNLTKLPLKIFENNTKLEILDLSHNQLISDVWNELGPLTELRCLLLDYNFIDSIPITINSLSKLEYLGVKFNKLTKLDIILSLPKLQYLLLEVNDIVYISETAVVNLKELKEFDLFSNTIIQLENSVFIENQKLEYLNLGSNNLPQVPVLSNLKRLKKVQMGKNQIASLSKLAFDNSTIFEIDLSNNDIKYIEPGTFDTANISFLNLAYNQLTKIENVFAKLVINKLDLSNNKLLKLSFSQFPQSLVELILKNNSIQEFDIEDCVTHLINKTMSLISLRLSTIKLTNLTDFCIPTSVETLDLSNNSIETFSFHPKYQALFQQHAVQLKEVRFISNNISLIYYDNILTSSKKRIMYEFKENPLKCNCDNVWLQDGFHCQNYVHLKTIRESIKNLDELTCTFDENPAKIKSLALIKNCSAIELCPSTENNISPCKDDCECRLQCSSAGLTQIPVANENNSHQSVLRLDGNNFTTINDGDFSTYTNLSTLVLNNSNINKISQNAFANLGLLETLNLADNMINILEKGLFDKLTHLKNLDLSGNNPTSLPDDIFAKLEQLNYLYLQRNLLKEIQLTQLYEMKLKELQLHDNPFECTCDFMQTIREYKHREVLKFELSCFDKNGTEIPFTESNSSYCQLEEVISPWSFWPYLLGALVAVVIKGTLVVYFWYEIKVIVYSCFRVRMCGASDLGESQNNNRNSKDRKC